MSTTIVITVLLTYFLLLILVGFLTTRKADGETFFTANRNSPWYLVAFGMIGATLSGVTFISIPGEVGNSQWTYLPLVLGNCVGYVVIALVLLPLFYRLRVVSIYSWLGTRFGERARLTGSFFFYYFPNDWGLIPPLLGCLCAAIGFFRCGRNPFCPDGIYHDSFCLDIYGQGRY